MLNICARLLFFWLSLILPVQAAVVELGGADAPGMLALNQGQLSFFRDKSQKLALEDIRQKQQAGEFQLLKGNLSAGYVPDVFWLHFSVDQKGRAEIEKWLEVIPAYLDSLQLYHFDSHDQLHKQIGGDFIPHSKKDIDYRATVFKLLLSPGQHEFYLRIKTSSTMVAEIRFWQPESFSKTTRTHYLLFGVYISLILTVLLFNAVNFAIFRQKIFLLYVIWLALNGTLWMSISGLVGEYILPESPLYNNLTLGILNALAAAMSFIFFTVFFEYRKYHPFIYPVLIFGAGVAIATAIATPLGYYQVFAPWLMLVAILSILTLPWPMIRIWRSGELLDRILVIMHVAYNFFLSLSILLVLALIPFSVKLSFSGMVSGLFHILTLHFVISQHYRKIEAQHKKTLEEALLAQKQIAIEKMYREEQSQLLSMITHEIRTPIAVIDAANASLQMLDGKLGESETDRLKRYERIQNAVKRMNTVMEMAIKQKDEESLPLESEPVDMDELTEEVIGLNRFDDLERIQLHIKQAGLQAQGDVRLLRIVLINLIDNAKKYSTPGSLIDIEISPETHSEVKGVMWRIINHGQPIPDVLLDKIFDKYQRGSEINNQGGMGLGLYLVKSIVRKHSGTISAANLQGGKVAFSLWLPVGN
jgi:signal transduction histidine kinase